MASGAHDNYLLALLRDAEELGEAHGKLRTGRVGRQWGLGSLNRAVVVMSVSAWEAYLEELVKEVLEAIRPEGLQAGNWPALKTAGLSQIGRFNNPDPDHVKALLADTIGLQDVTARWSWKAVNAERARARLREVLKHRHAIAHGVNPRPTIHNWYAEQLPGFFRQLGRCTDQAVREHVVSSLGAAEPWPR
jgi:hypothetical protein